MSRFDAIDERFGFSELSEISDPQILELASRVVPSLNAAVFELSLEQPERGGLWMTAGRLRLSARGYESARRE